MPSPWVIVGGAWLLCSAIVAVLNLWEWIQGNPRLPLRYELVMVALGPITIAYAVIYGREDDE